MPRGSHILLINEYMVHSSHYESLFHFPSIQGAGRLGRRTSTRTDESAPSLTRLTRTDRTKEKTGRNELLQPAERKARRSTKTATNTGAAAARPPGSRCLRSSFPSSSTIASTTAAAYPSFSTSTAVLSPEFQNLKRFHFASTHDNTTSGAAVGEVQGDGSDAGLWVRLPGSRISEGRQGVRIVGAG